MQAPVLCGQPWPSATVERAAARIAAGESPTEVARDLGVDRSTVYRWAVERGVQRRRRRPSGHVQALRDAAVEAMRKGLESNAAIARRLNVSRTELQRWAREEGLTHRARRLSVDAEAQATVERLTARIHELEAAIARLSAAPQPAKPTSPAARREDETGRLKRELAALRLRMERTAQQLRDTRKASPWERITWALGMEITELLPPSVTQALIAGKTVQATFAGRTIDRVDTRADLVLTDEALPLFRFFSAHRESAELRDEDVQRAADDIERAERDRVAALGGGLDQTRATREAMARNMRIERDDTGTLPQVDAAADAAIARRQRSAARR